MNRGLLIICIFFFLGCDTNRHTENSTKSIPVNKAPSTTKTGILVEHNFVNKKGEILDTKELYFQASIQDYYIKFCESNVSREDLEPFIGKAISIEGEIIDGLWDDCGESDQEIQSRTGYYMTIKKLIN